MRRSPAPHQEKEQQRAVVVDKNTNLSAENRAISRYDQSRSDHSDSVNTRARTHTGRRLHQLLQQPKRLLLRQVRPNPRARTHTRTRPCTRTRARTHARSHAPRTRTLTQPPVQGRFSPHAVPPASTPQPLPPPHRSRAPGRECGPGRAQAPEPCAAPCARPPMRCRARHPCLPLSA